MFTLPSFTLGDILTFYKVIRIKTEAGAELPFICVNNRESRSWKSPEHPTDRNTVISDTLWTEPKTLSLTGHVPVKSWERFRQLVEGSAEKGSRGISGYLQNVRNNILGGSAGDPGAIGLYTVTLLGGVYKDMALISLTRTESPEENSGYAVTLEFRQVLKAESATHAMTKENVASAGYADTIERGKTSLKNTSLLKKGVDATKGYIGGFQ